MSEPLNLDDLLEEVCLLQGLLSIKMLARLKRYQIDAQCSLSVLIQRVAAQSTPKIQREIRALIVNLSKSISPQEDLSTTITLSLDSVGNLDTYVSQFFIAEHKLNAEDTLGLYEGHDEEVLGPENTLKDDDLKHLSVDSNLEVTSNSWLDTVYELASEDLQLSTLPPLSSALTPISPVEREPMNQGVVQPRDTSHGSRYLLKDRLGEGGMSYVELVYDVDLGREVALKRIKPDAHLVARYCFEVEARVMSQLHHPSILPVYDIISLNDVSGLITSKGQGDHREVSERVGDRASSPPHDSVEVQSQDPQQLSAIAYTMRVACHKSLHEVLQTQTLELHDLCSIIKQVALTLEHAHQRGIIHRDIKPHNILLGDAGEVYLTDWGVCMLDSTHPESHLITDRLRYALVGSPPFMAPEQARCNPRLITPLVDIYGLGATLYYGLTGHTPIQGQTLNQILNALSHQEITPAHQVSQDQPHTLLVPKELSQLCQTALSRDPQNRFPSARAFAEAIDRFLKGEIDRERREEICQEAMERGQSESTRFYQLLQSRQKSQLNIKQMRLHARRTGDEEVKRALWSEEEALDQLVIPLEEAFSHATSAYRSVLTQEPNHPHAKRELAQLFTARYEDAEANGDRSLIAYFEERVRRYSDHDQLRALDGVSEITLSGLPDHAIVSVCGFEAQRYRTIDYERFKLLSPLTYPLELGRGSYVLKISHPASAEVRVPIFIKRSTQLSLFSPLPREDAIPEGFTYIRDQWAIQTYPVTVAQYFEFLNDLDPVEASGYAPRFHHTAYATPNQDGRYEAPFIDPDGDEWQPDWPIFLVSQEDATAYTRWLSERLGRSTRLPTAEEWLQAAQGADGRPYPWGLSFDPSLCSMRESTQGKPIPTPVGAYQSDRSPYGIYDVAGTIAQWTSSLWPGTEQDYRVMGAAFSSMALLCDLGQEFRAPGKTGLVHIGFRVLLELTGKDFIDAPHH